MFSIFSPKFRLLLNCFKIFLQTDSKSFSKLKISSQKLQIKTSNLFRKTSNLKRSWLADGAKKTLVNNQFVNGEHIRQNAMAWTQWAAWPLAFLLLGFSRKFLKCFRHLAVRCCVRYFCCCCLEEGNNENHVEENLQPKPAREKISRERRKERREKKSREEQKDSDWEDVDSDEE